MSGRFSSELKHIPPASLCGNWKELELEIAVSLLESLNPTLKWRKLDLRCDFLSLWNWSKKAVLWTSSENFPRVVSRRLLAQLARSVELFSWASRSGVSGSIFAFNFWPEYLPTFYSITAIAAVFKPRHQQVSVKTTQTEQRVRELCYFRRYFMISNHL